MVFVFGVSVGQVGSKSVQVNPAPNERPADAASSRPSLASRLIHSVSDPMAADDWYLPKMEVDPLYKWKKIGDVSSISGRIKNTGDRSVSYWLLTASFYGKDRKVLDKAENNSTTVLNPGESDNFEVMTAYDPAHEGVKLEVTQVVLK